MSSFLDAVLGHAERNPHGVCARIVSRKTPEGARSFAEVAEGAGRAAASLAERGVGKGDRVVLIGTHHLDLYGVWLGAVWLGAVPCLLAEPSVRIDKNVYWARLDALLSRIGAKVVALDPRIEVDERFPSSFTRATYDELVRSNAAAPPIEKSSAEDLLLLQHSSGTTGLQKGVMLSHGAVMRHADAYMKSLAPRADDVIVSWLPLYHDMGLIACFVCPLIAGIPVVWLSPFEWIASPGLLLDAVTEHRATLMWLPNFAYSFLGQRGLGRDQKINLSSLRAVINCSEPVTAEAMGAFADRFAPHGLDPRAIHTCYAMAENVFAVTASDDRTPPKTTRIDEKTWRLEHRAVAAGSVTGSDIVQVSNGRALPGVEICIADDSGSALPPGQAGRVLIRSPFLFSGYHGRERDQEARFDAQGFYDTGDVGWIDEEGHLFVTGRKKDLVILGGKNVYPQDVEQVASEIAGVHPGRVVCFGVPLRAMGTEGLVLLAESAQPEETWPELVAAIRAACPARLDLDLSDVRILPLGQLRKSTSGKLARAGNRDWYLEGKFGAAPRWIAAEVKESHE